VHLTLASKGSHVAEGKLSEGWANPLLNFLESIAGSTVLRAKCLSGKFFKSHSLQNFVHIKSHCMFRQIWPSSGV
jgi:hypothetical protein